MSDMRFCFCVLGWHYPDEFYERLYDIPGDKFIISHRDEMFLAGRPLHRKLRNDLRVMPNVGLDWGGYHQFNELVDLARYDVVIYSHDDLLIKDTAFPQAIAAKLRDGSVKVVGNGCNGADSEFRYGKYRHVMRWDDDDDFVVRTVRGSFFAARTEIFERIGNFPVHWAASERNLKKGNISLRNFGYIVTKTYGVEAISYLEPESWLETRYLIELRRGVPVSGHARAIEG
jgi:hypothetical protein